MTWSSASAHRLLCDLKFCISSSTHGIVFGLKFRLRTRNILRLKVPQFPSAYRIVCHLGALKWRNSASAQGKYCDLEVTQFRFHPINLVRLEVSQFRFHTRALTFKSRNSASAQRISLTWSSASAQGIYYVSKFSSSAFAHRTICDLKFSTIYCDLNIRSSASAKKTSFEIPHFCVCTWA